MKMAVLFAMEMKFHLLGVFVGRFWECIYVASSSSLICNVRMF